MATTATVKLRIRENPGYRRFIRASVGGLSYVVRVGFVGDSGEARHEDSDLTNAHIASILEWGYPEGNIEARPAVGPSFDANLDKYQALCRRVAEGVSSGKVTAEQGLGLLGAQMAADLKDFIVGGAPIAPENRPSVKERKMRKATNTKWGIRTWVDSGALVDSITWIVVSEGEST